METKKLIDFLKEAYERGLQEIDVDNIGEAIKGYILKEEAETIKFVVNRMMEYSLDARNEIIKIVIKGYEITMKFNSKIKYKRDKDMSRSQMVIRRWTDLLGKDSFNGIINFDQSEDKLIVTVNRHELLDEIAT